MPLLLLIGRILFGGYFFISGVSHFKRIEMMTQYAASKHVPSPKSAVYLGGILLILGGAGVVLGFYPAISLTFLLAFLIPVTFIMHQFWKESDPMKKASESVSFLKNIALIGAVLMLYSLTTTPWAVSF